MFSILHRAIGFFTALLLLIPGAFPQERALLPKNANYEATAYGRAVQLSDSYYDQYFQPLFSHLSAQPYSFSHAYNWDAGGLLSLTSKLYALDPDAYATRLRQVERTVERYRKVEGGCFAGYVAAWTPFTFMASRHHICYDDGMWVGREFAELYDLTGSEKHKALAREVADFSIADAWVDLPAEIFAAAGLPVPTEPVGGFYWDLEHDKVHTCSTAPAIQLLAMVYRITGVERYLDYALRAYRLLPYLENEKGTFSDNIRFVKDEDNNILGWAGLDRAVYTYNSGSPIAAAVELYKATGDNVFLDDAFRWAACADREFTRPGGAYIQQLHWFHLILMGGFAKLLEFDDSGDVAGYIAHMRGAFDYAYENYRSQGFSGVMENRLPKSLVGGFEDNTDFRLSPLEPGAAAEVFAILALAEKRGLLG